MLRRRLSAAAVAAAALFAPLAVFLASGTPASAADTPQCAAAVTAPHGNAPAQWCSGQEDVTLALGIAATNKVAAYQPATVKPWATTNGSEDFAVYRSDPANSQIKTFEFAPHGVMSNLCFAVNNKRTAIVFKTCNPANHGQQFQPGSSSADGGNSWDSVLTGQAITIPGGAFSHLILSNDAGGVNQGFTFQQ
jgi:hypothetical protein